MRLSILLLWEEHKVSQFTLDYGEAVLVSAHVTLIVKVVEKAFLIYIYFHDRIC